jgi:long-chain acyl-CoA synthetase
MNLTTAIFENARAGAVALRDGDQLVCYGELAVAMDAAASAVSACPMPGDCRPRVALAFPNGIAHIVWSLALLKAGATVVPVPGELAPPERLELLRATGCHALLAPAAMDRAGASAMRNIFGDELAGEAWWHALPGNHDLVREDQLRGLDAALIRFSSGTTGKSKGVVLSHRSILGRVRACNHGLGIGPGDRVLWILPMAHHFAVSIVLYLLHGATTVLARSHLGADLLAELRQSRATVLYAAPYHFGLLANCPGASPSPDLRLAVSTAAPLPAATAEKFRETFGLPLTQGYGIIEAGLPALNTEDAESLPDSVGRAQPGFDIRIDQPDEHGVGEVLLRGPGFFDAYLSPWSPRADVLDHGWLRTGDLGRLDGEGRLFLRGRLKSVINVAGLKCFPEEVELVLNTFPGVRESRVAARPHPDTGSIPVAEIVPEDPACPPSVPALLRHCRGRLATYKIPVRVEIVPTLPRTPSGKILRSIES